MYVTGTEIPKDSMEQNSRALYVRLESSLITGEAAESFLQCLYYKLEKKLTTCDHCLKCPENQTSLLKYSIAMFNIFTFSCVSHYEHHSGDFESGCSVQRKLTL